MIDLLPENQKKYIAREYGYRKYTVICFCAFVASVVTLLLFVPSYMLAVNKNTDARERLAIEPAQDSVATENDLKHEIDDANIYLSVLRQPATTTPLFSQFVFMISKDKTSDNAVTDISYSIQSDGRVKVDVSGVAKSRDSLSAFADALSREQGIAKIEIPISNYAKDADISFSFSLNS